MIELEISTHENETFNVQVEEFDAAALNEKLNDSNVNTVLIGNKIFSRILVKKVMEKEVENEI